MSDAKSTESRPTDHKPSRTDSTLIRAAGVGALLLPIVWAATAGLEFARAHLSHSLVSRPERLFGGEGAAWWPILAILVCAAAVALAAVGATIVVRAEHRRLAIAATTLLAAAAGCRVAIMAFPPDSAMYGESPIRGMAGIGLIVLLPVALTLAGIAIGRRGPALAWLSGVVAIAILWHAVWAVVWSWRSGALQPQLLAVEGVEGLTAAWAAAVGVWLIGLPGSLASVAGRLGAGLRAAIGPRLPVPGRKAAVVVAVVGVFGAVSPAAAIVSSDGATITAQLNGRTGVQAFPIAGIDRTARVYRPAQVAAKPGLVIVLHGVFGSGFRMEADSNFDVQADRLGWIAAYPDGVLDGWDAFGSTPSWGSHPGADDVAFVSALIDTLESTDGVDPDRVYVTGLSRGAMMTYRLGCALSGRVAAIAPVSGNMADSAGTANVPCALARPVSVLAIHGTADGTIPIAGGFVDIPFSPMADVMAKWRTWDSCGTGTSVSIEGASTTTSWSCADDSTVSQRIVTGGWHTWPRSSGAATPTNPDDFEASRVIANFFAAHPRVAHP